MLLKVILCAYTQRVSGDSAPHFTTLTAFVSSLNQEMAQLFAPSALPV